MPAKKADQGDGAPVTSASITQQYERPPSFTDLLPWMEYIPESKSFLLEDGLSMGALFEITPVGCEARTPVFMSQLRDAIQIAINESIPERDDAPWVLCAGRAAAASFQCLIGALSIPSGPRVCVFTALPVRDGEPLAGNIPPWGTV